MLRPLSILAVATVLAATARADHPVHFDVQLLIVDANEGCDNADFKGSTQILFNKRQ